MPNNKELKALLSLIDDPQQEIFAAVSKRIIELGIDAIPHLEYLWEDTYCITTQEKIEGIIHKIQYADLQNQVTQWSGNAYHDLLVGSILAAKYQFPQLNTTHLLEDIEKIRRDIWLELNDFLTPLEQANIMNKMLFGYYKLQGNELSYNNVDDFFINKVVQRKQGNALSLGIMYQILVDLLDINACLISIPKQMFIAYYNSNFYPSNSQNNHEKHIQFYVDAYTGTSYSYTDIVHYLQRNNLSPEPAYFKPICHKKLIQILLNEVSKCYHNPQQLYKQQEVEALCNLLK